MLWGEARCFSFALDGNLCEILAAGLNSSIGRSGVANRRTLGGRRVLRADDLLGTRRRIVVALVVIAAHRLQPLDVVLLRGGLGDRALQLAGARRWWACPGVLGDRRRGRCGERHTNADGQYSVPCHPVCPAIFAIRPTPDAVPEDGEANQNRYQRKTCRYFFV